MHAGVVVGKRLGIGAAVAIFHDGHRERQPGLLLVLVGRVPEGKAQKRDAVLRKLKELGQNRLNVTIGSALDLFGGPMNYEETVKFIAK